MRKTTTPEFMNKPDLLEPQEAESRGYRALTNPYYVPNEQWMLDAVLRDMRGCDHVLVRSRDVRDGRVREGVEVWRVMPEPLKPQVIDIGDEI